MSTETSTPSKITPASADTKYTLAKVKTFRGMDGVGLNADLLRNGKLVAVLTDEGSGGMLDFDWVDQKHGQSEEEATFKAFIAETVPPDPTDKDSTLDPRTLQQFAMEGWVNALVDKTSNDKRMKRLCKTKTCYQIGDQIGGEEFYVTKGLGPELRARIQAKYPGKPIRWMNDEVAL